MDTFSKTYMIFLFYLLILLILTPEHQALYADSQINPLKPLNRSNKVLNGVPRQAQLYQFLNNKHVTNQDVNLNQMYTINRDHLQRSRPVPLDRPPSPQHPQKVATNSIAIQSNQVTGDLGSHRFHNQFAAKISNDNGRSSSFQRTTTARPPKMRLFAPPTKMAPSNPPKNPKWPHRRDHSDHHDHNDHDDHRDYHPSPKFQKYYDHYEHVKHLRPIKHHHFYDKKLHHYMSGDVGIKYLTTMNDVVESGHESPAPIQFIKVSEPMEYKVPVTTLHYSNQALYAPKRLKEETKLPDDYKYLPYPPSFITFTTTTEKPVMTTYAYAAPVVPPSTSTGYFQKLKDKFKFPINFKPDLFNHREPQSLLESYIPSWEIHKMMQQYDHKPSKEPQVHLGPTVVYVVPVASKPTKGFFRNKWHH